MADDRRPDPLDSDPGASHRERLEREKEAAQRHKSEALKILRQAAEYAGEMRLQVKEIRDDNDDVRKAVNDFEEELRQAMLEVQRTRKELALAREAMETATNKIDMLTHAPIETSQTKRQSTEPWTNDKWSLRIHGPDRNRSAAMWVALVLLSAAAALWLALQAGILSPHGSQSPEPSSSLVVPSSDSGG